MEKTLKIVGQDKIKVKPDHIVFKIDFSKNKSSYENALEETKVNYESIKGLINDIESNEVDVKTTNFRIDKYYNNKEQRYDGFTYTQSIELSMNRDDLLLNKIFELLGTIDNISYTNVLYTIKNPTKVKDKLLKKCIEDAKHKAKIIESASNIKLGSIVRINYNDNGSPFELCSYSRASSQELEPLDIEFEDSITIEYEIL